MRVKMLKIALAAAAAAVIIPVTTAFAETGEEIMNNLIGPSEQYNTMLSPVYLKANYTEEYINPASGDLTVTQTDYVLPGRNGLDLEIKRIYKSGISNVREMKVKYVSGAWVDYTSADATVSSFYEDRYNIGIGMRFSFPSIEMRENGDGSRFMFLHTESGDVYRLTGPVVIEGVPTYFPQGQTIEDVKVEESSAFSNGQSDGRSKYVMAGKDGKKTYFASDGRILAIADRYGNTITFRYTTLSYQIGSKEIRKRLISEITDTVGREITIEYNEDHNFTAGPIQPQQYGKDETHEYTQHPNTKDSGDLQGEFQVVINLPGDKRIVYDKSAVLLSDDKKVIRTRLQRVYDVDRQPKYHFWYEQPELGFTFANGKKYSVTNRYENLVQIDSCKTNKIIRYTYDTFTRRLADDGSMQYRKIFRREDLVKKNFDPAKEKFLDKFSCEKITRTEYRYTNEPGGFGYSGYRENDDEWLKHNYRYYTDVIDDNGSITKYTYDGLHQLVMIEKRGNDHKETIVREHDEMKLVKKKERHIYDIQNGKETGKSVKVIENYRYDKYGNLTNYTGPEAERDEEGYPVDTERTVVYSYHYDKFHVLKLKTWKIDGNKTAQIIYDADSSGNIVRETKVHTNDVQNYIVTDYRYDQYGNLIYKKVSSSGNEFITQYEYGTDIDGTDHKGAYMTREYTGSGQDISEKHYCYDFSTGNLTAEIDGNGNRTDYEYDILDRVIEVNLPGQFSKHYDYRPYKYKDFEIEYTDPDGNRFMYIYDIFGNFTEAKVRNEDWETLKTIDYDSFGNKILEKDANGHSIRFSYDSLHRLKEKSFYENNTVKKASISIDYTMGYDDDTMMLMALTDEEGYKSRYYYDKNDRLVKLEQTPDKNTYYATLHIYDYVGNLTSTTDALGNVTLYEYDDLSRLICITDALGNETTYSYNGIDKQTEVKEPEGRITRYFYDIHQRLIEKRILEEGADGYYWERYSYDNAGNLVRHTNGIEDEGFGKVLYDKTFEYNSRNLVSDEYTRIDETRTAHTRMEYDGNGNIALKREYADSEKTEYFEYRLVYDFAGRPVEEEGLQVIANGRGIPVISSRYLTKKEYDLAGNLLAEKRLNGDEFDVTTYKYDYMNRLIEKREPFTGDKQAITVYTYDKKGNMKTQTVYRNGIACTTAYTYDGFGNVLTKTTPEHATTTYIYDANSNMVKEIPPAYYGWDVSSAPGIVYEYDALGRKTVKAEYDGQNMVVVEYLKYDGRGNIVLRADAMGYNPANPGNSVGETYEYDVFDNVVKYVSAQTNKGNLDEGTDNFTGEYKYDGPGRKVTETDGLGNTTTYSYYMNGRLKETVYPDGTRESYDYDLTGKMYEEKTDRAGGVTRTYKNIFGKDWKIIYPDNTKEEYSYSTKGLLTLKKDRRNNPTYYEYDGAGNLTRTREYIGKDNGKELYKITDNRYDEAGLLLSRQTIAMARDIETGNVTLTEAGDLTEYLYDRDGRLTYVKGPAGRETINSYDINGNLSVRKMKIDGDNWKVQRYNYDFMGRMIGESTLVEAESIEGRHLVNAVFDNEYHNMVLSTKRYEYYENGLLKSATDPNGAATVYEYDLDGRIVKKSDALLNSSYYSYDLNGNMRQEKNRNGVTTYYDYDPMNRLIRKIESSTVEGEPAITRYIYDEMGNLVKRILPEQYDQELDTPALVNSMIGTSYTYDLMGRRTSVISPEGNTIEYTEYDENGNVKKVVDGLRFNGSMETSPGTTYEYDGLNRLTAVTDVLGNTTVYRYDVLGNVTVKIDCRGNMTTYRYNADSTLAETIYPDGSTVTYGYDLLGRLIWMQDGEGNRSTYEYGALDKRTKETDPEGYSIRYLYDLAGNNTAVIDKRGTPSYMEYDSLGRLVMKKTAVRKEDNGSLVYLVEEYTYDNEGNVLSKTLSDSSGRDKERRTEYTYYENGLVKTISTNAGQLTEYRYDKNGNLTLEKKLREEDRYDIRKFEYDTENRKIKEITLLEKEQVYGSESMGHLSDPEFPGMLQSITGFEYDILGNMTRQISPRGYETGNTEEYSTIYTYDEMNRLEKTIFLHDGSRVYSERQYDQNGNLTVQTDPRGYSTEYTYDSMDRVETVTVDGIQSVSYTYDKAGRKKTETNANGGTITYGYDRMGRVKTITDPFDVVVETNEYDGNGNLISRKDAKGNTTIYEYNLAGRTTLVTTPENRKQGTYTMKYEYSVYGEKTAEIDALGNRKEYAYNAAGMLIMVMFSMGTGVSYGYDKLGNMLQMKDGEGRIKEYEYGPFGMMTSYTDPEGGTTEYMYDLEGNTRHMRDRNGNTTLYEYDNRNLLVLKQVVETGDIISYAYDASGNRKSMTDESGMYRYEYNSRNLLLEKYRDDELLISYEYDGMGNITRVTDSLGNSTGYTYDLAGRMETVTYDGKTAVYKYDVNGNRESIRYPGGITEEYEYDGENRLTRLVNRKPDGSILSEYSYTYDLAGRQKTKTDSYGTTEYSYDGKGRVTKVSAPGKTTVYAYDNADNRVSLIETYASEQPSGFIDLNTGVNIQYMVKRSQYTYSGTDRLLMLTEKMYDASGEEILTKTTRYSYDGNGNETSRSVSYMHPHNIGMRRTTRGSIYGDGMEGEFPALMERTHSTFNGFNRLKKMESIQAGTRTIVEYLYDGDGLRTQKISRNSDSGYIPEVTNYLYDRQHVILETDGEGNLKARYTRGINYISHLDNTNTERFYLYNGHGDVVQTIDDQGNVHNSYEYDIFGNPVLTIEIYGNSIRYAGEFLDVETGLYYLRARYYNPYTGRFTSEDSYWGETGNPLSLNLYTYCHNDPVLCF